MKLWWVVEVKSGGAVVTLGMFTDRARAIRNCDTDECMLVELDAIAVAHRLDDVDTTVAQLEEHRHVSFLCKIQEGQSHPPCSGTCDGGGTGELCEEPCICSCHALSLFSRRVADALDGEGLAWAPEQPPSPPPGT